MRLSALLLLAASVSFGQTPARPATAPAGTTPKTTTTAAKPAVTPASTVKKPGSDMPLLHGIVKPLFSERYEDIKIGTGAVAEPFKIYHVNYSGYLAATGQKFDSSFDHRVPVMKDGKPQLGDPQPMVFPQGVGRLIPGFDQGFTGMHIGGKRRIFIPWQLAYGMRELPARQSFIGIPAKSDLIFDVELLDVTEVPAAPAQPLGGGAPRPQAPRTPNPNAQPSGSAPETSPQATAPQGSTSAPTSNPAQATPPPAATTPPK